MEALENKLKAFIQNEVDYIEKTGSTKISTCDHSNWDRDIWTHRQDIMNAFIEKGYSVYSKINWGVLDIYVTKHLSL